jgi:hypothetical protein
MLKRYTSQIKNKLPLVINKGQFRCISAIKIAWVDDTDELD